MPENVYDIGDEVRLSALFTVKSGDVDVPTNPTTVTMKVKPPDGVLVNYSSSVVHDGPGAYHKDVIITKSGEYFWRYEGTGTVTAASEGAFQVRKKKVTP